MKVFTIPAKRAKLHYGPATHSIYFPMGCHGHSYICYDSLAHAQYDLKSCPVGCKIVKFKGAHRYGVDKL